MRTFERLDLGRRSPCRRSSRPAAAGRGAARRSSGRPSRARARARRDRRPGSAAPPPSSNARSTIRIASQLRSDAEHLRAQPLPRLRSRAATRGGPARSRPARPSSTATSRPGGRAARRERSPLPTAASYSLGASSPVRAVNSRFAPAPGETHEPEVLHRAARLAVSHGLHEQEDQEAQAQSPPQQGQPRQAPARRPLTRRRGLPFGSIPAPPPLRSAPPASPAPAAHAARGLPFGSTPAPPPPVGSACVSCAGRSRGGARLPFGSTPAPAADAVSFPSCGRLPRASGRPFRAQARALLACTPITRSAIVVAANSARHASSARSNAAWMPHGLRVLARRQRGGSAAPDLGAAERRLFAVDRFDDVEHGDLGRAGARAGSRPADPSPFRSTPARRATGGAWRGRPTGTPWYSASSAAGSAASGGSAASSVHDVHAPLDAVRHPHNTDITCPR